MHTRTGLTILGMSFCVFSTTAAAGGNEDIRVFRTSAYTINTGDANFAGAGGDYEIRWGFLAQFDQFDQGYSVGNPGYDLAISVRTLGHSVYASGAGDVEVNDFWFDPDLLQNGALRVDWNLTYDDKFDLDIEGTLRAGYSFDAAEGLAGGRTDESFLFTRIEDNQSIMRFVGGGSALVDTGDGFAVDVRLDGRWDPNATGEGSVTFLGIHSSFEVLDFFTYNEATDTTRFRAVSDSYTRDPDLRFDLVGAAVPAPGGLAALLALGGLATRRRR